MALSLFHLHGDLADLMFPRLLAALRDDDFTGVFQATTRSGGSDRPHDEEAGTTREIHFAAGHVAWAISTDRDESLKAYLLRNGSLTETQWAEAEARAGEVTLREALVSLGFVSARELMQIERGRAEEIVLALFTARTGEYRVRERQLSPGTPDLGIDPRPLILRGILELADRSLITDEVGSLDTVYVVKRSVLEEPGLSLPGEFQSVLRHIDGRRSIAQVCSATSLPDSFVSSVFAALSIVGAVKRNYAKSPARSRSEIVRGAEVASPSGRHPAAPEPPSRGPGAPVDQMELPKISTEPFPGEGPVSLIEQGETAADPEEAGDAATDPVAEDEPVSVPAGLFVEGDEDGRPAQTSHTLQPIPEAPSSARPEDSAPEPVPLILREERTPIDAAPSVYSDMGPDEASRPWFLVGGAVMVGLVALFLIMMAQNPGGAGEVALPSPVEAPAPDTADIAEDPAIADDPEYATPDPPATGPRLADGPGSDMLGVQEESTDGALESLVSGDYRSAARLFGRQIAQQSGDYSIQLLTACQDGTVKRAVDAARASSNLFILSTMVEGRNCYRVYWGRYPTQKKAQEALRRDVPSVFRQDRNQPRVTRLAGS